MPSRPACTRAARARIDKANVKAHGPPRSTKVLQRLWMWRLVVVARRRCKLPKAVLKLPRELLQVLGRDARVGMRQLATHG
jgi:hypothetical protein